MSEPPDISAPKDPAAYRPRPLLGVSFWAMIALSVLCVLAGVAIATVAPRLWAPRPAPHAAETPPAPEPMRAPATSAPAPGAVTETQPPSPPAIASLSARLGILESRQSQMAQAAAAALAAAAVADAAEGSGPFAEEVATLAASMPPSPELRALAQFAQAGAPSRTALASSFPDYAARAASAGHAPGENAGLVDRIGYMLSKVVSLRRVGDVPGGSVDAQLARAEQALADGDLERALHILDRLPPAARDALGPWRARAERRAEIDRAAQALRARALQALAAETRGSGA